MHPGHGVDVFDAVRPAQVRVVCFNREWTLYPDCAYEWLGLVAADMGQLTGILPGAVAMDQCEDMLRLALSFDDRDDRWANAARVALGRAGGRDWWWVLNLSKRCLQGWPYVNGQLLHRGVSARQLPYADWLDAAYMLLWDRQDERGRIMLDMELNRVPQNIPVRRNWSQIQAAAAAFAAD